MKTLKLTFIAVAAAGLVAFANVLPGRETLEMAPKESEVIARLDVERLLQTEQFKAALNQYGEEKARNQAVVLENLSGLDLFSDIKEMWLFGKIDVEESNIIIARGEFERDKLIALVRMNPEYNKQTVQNVEVHHWHDDGEKFGCFLGEDLLVVAGSEEAMTVMLRTWQDPETSFSRTATGSQISAASINTPVIWGALIDTPTVKGDFGNLARAVDLSHVTLALNSAGENVSVDMNLVPDNVETLDDYEAIGLGGVAMARLLGDEHEMAGLFARKANVQKNSDGRSLQVTGSLTTLEIFNIIKKNALD